MGGMRGVEVSWAASREARLLLVEVWLRSERAQDVTARRVAAGWWLERVRRKSLRGGVRHPIGAKQARQRRAATRQSGARRRDEAASLALDRQTEHGADGRGQWRADQSQMRGCGG